MSKPQIFDAHAHMFPEDVVERWEWYAAQDEWFAALTRETPQSRVREAFSTAEETLALADAAGVDVVVMQGWYWRRHELCVRNNDYMHQLIQRWPDRFKAYGSINPTFGAQAVREVERCHAMGFSGIGELGPGGNGFSLDHPGLLDVLEAAQALGLAVNFHVGEPVGHAYMGKDLTPIEGFYRIAKQFPGLRLVLAHLGGGLPFYELQPDVHEAFANVYYDLAASPLLYDIRSVRVMVDLVGVERVLFGTDFPLTIYPRKCREADFSLFIEDIRQNAGLTPYEWERVMGENMRDLLAM